MSLEDFYFLVTFMPRRITRREYVDWLDEQYGVSHQKAWDNKARAEKRRRTLELKARGRRTQ